jgi:hypothetical protein
VCWWRAGAKISRAIVCDGVKIGADAVICEGAVISFNCVVSPGHVVPPHTRITLCTHLNDVEDSDDETEGPTGALDADSLDEDQVYGPLPSVIQVLCSALASSIVLFIPLVVNTRVFVLVLGRNHAQLR